MTQITTCTAQTLHNLPASAVIIDVRTGMEHAEQRLSCAHLHIPLEQISADMLAQTHRIAKDTPIYMLCRGGKRAAQAAESLQAGGYTQVQVIEGGILSCVAGGIATCSADAAAPPLSLERQVRIAAGLLVVIGAALALALDSIFALLPLAVGSGLIFAGMTDRCGLALLLTKAPWNAPR